MGPVWLGSFCLRSIVRWCSQAFVGVWLEEKMNAEYIASGLIALLLLIYLLYAMLKPERF